MTTRCPTPERRLSQRLRQTTAARWRPRLPSQAWLLAMLLAGFALGAQAEGVRSAAMLSHTCAGCHGTDGASAGAAMPTIAGMDKGYLVKVLEDYKDDVRPSTIMGRIMRGYSDQEIAAIASFFADRPWVSTERPIDGELAYQGELIHQQRCESCHADGGRGQDARSPRLAGQWGPYIQYALETCRARGESCKKRQGAERVMVLEDAEIQALAHYYESQK
ncbi:c-type cytochrome [Lamprobacter modestohalophilus]|uniref:c-type cytochrome n=1 Tax=Lamprobacter modestohalophilus TaxID=1064514 RepID=UPI001F5BBBF1|nr:c-type cytochrome [Lamprobacter modestohalophilus]